MVTSLTSLYQGVLPVGRCVWGRARGPLSVRTLHYTLYGELMYHSLLANTVSLITITHLSPGKHREEIMWSNWNEYVTHYLVDHDDPNTGKTAHNICERGAILSSSDGTAWGSTPEFKLEHYDISMPTQDGNSAVQRVDELLDLKYTFDGRGRPPSHGIRLMREVYQVVNFDSERGLMYLKKSGGGACVARTNSTFVIGTFRSDHKTTTYQGEEVPQNFGLVNRCCEALQKVLLESNL